jgi:hypothetical protein
MAAEIGIGHHVVREIAASLIPAHWVPVLLKEKHKLQCRMFPHNCWNDMLLKVMTLYSMLMGDKSWFHHCDP